MTDSKKILTILSKINFRLQENKDFLTGLDSAIGDGDHGINMSRGFLAVMEKLPQMEDKDIATILKNVGMALVSTVGGASGPLYGTAFMRAGAAAAGKTALRGADFLALLDAAVEGIRQRGKAQKGEKTMLDALVPALEAFEAEHASGASPRRALERAVDAAREGVEHTKTIVATKGRASYLGERSLGHQDPGATSALLMLEALLESLE
ncbi:MAG: dihydroxyacetone kinase subunit DhaL [Fretibacterium sp.]|nr:dihydroxyacetone kinase subunit DhaL [Fretibacterium sp.]